MGVSGPPCRQCGTPLRWFAEQNAWGCDRCRQMFPATPPVPGSPPQARKGSGMKLAIGALVVIGGIVAIAVVAGGGSKASDPASARIARDEEAWSKFRDEMCACKDRACARKVIDEVGKYVDSNEGQPDPPPSKKLKAIMQEQEICATAIATGANRNSHEDELPSDDVMVQEIENLRDKMCECSDKACAQEALEGLQDWGKQYKPSFDKQPVEARRKAMAAVQAQTKCYEKIMGK